MPVTTSVVICAYTTDRWPDLVAAVGSVRCQSKPADQIVLVVDHNPDLLSRARTEFDGVDVIASSGTKGLSGARNTGTRAATGDVVVYLDDDAVAEPDWLDRLTAPYADPRVIGVGGAARPSWETSEPGWWPVEFSWVVGCSYRGQPTSLAPVRNLMGCNMSLRKHAVDAVGGFDTGLGRTADSAAGCEETELCIRVSERFPDYVFLHEPESVVRHRVPAARASWRHFRTRCYAEGVSKAGVAHRVGESKGLATERAYVRRILPSGVVRNLARTYQGEMVGMARAAAIVAGLSFTVAGFASARVRVPRAPASRTETVAPVLPLIVDLDAPSTPLPVRDDRYDSALCLVLRDGDPVAKTRVDLNGDEVLTRDLFRHLPSRPLHWGDDSGQGAGSVMTVPAAISMAAPSMGATVVIATRDRPDALAQCVASVLSGTVAPERVVVVDNAPSDDRTAELVSRLAERDPCITYVREDRPGLANAHNAALPHLTGDVVAFTDDDVLVHQRWLERLVRAFTDDQQAVCVTGMIAPRELDTLPQQWVEGNAIYDKGLHRRVFDAGAHRPDDPLFPYTAGALGSGANMAFRTDYLMASGGFDPALGAGTPAMGGDDLAAFYDVVRSGRRLVYEPSAIVLHPHYRDRSALRRQVYGYGAGLGAHLTRCLLRDPWTALVLLRHVRATGRRATQILHPSTAHGLPPYPQELSREQRRGLISGPWRYLLSRSRAARVAPRKAIT